MKRNTVTMEKLLCSNCIAQKSLKQYVDGKKKDTFGTSLVKLTNKVSCDLVQRLNLIYRESLI